MSGMNVAPDDATAAQIGAADPDSNVWLVANAGSGKTKVLTDRVARLLLRGVDPQNILCLTYTKAAAAEMQNRLFRRLGAWAMADGAALRANLAELGEGSALPDESLRRARQLFARAIETPGGIRIQTIHSFCAGLLRRFPLEAGASPAFTELDDRSAALLRSDILEVMAEGPESALFETILPDVGERVDELLTQIVARRADMLRVPDQVVLRRAFGLPPEFDADQLCDETFGPGDLDLLQRVAEVLALSKGKTDREAAITLRALVTRDPATIAALEGVFLYKTGENAGTARIDRFPTKDAKAALGADLDQLQALMHRIADARPLRLALVAVAKAMALHCFGAAFLRRYEAVKAARGLLDFDDFITRATRLLTNPEVAPWVLYRLDGSIDHVLVDEAQDTSPAQWQIIAALTEEFTAGEGGRSAVPRSLFVVGDKKQSIYSFQGADVVAFDGWKGRFGEAFSAAGAPLTERSLIHSFRSSRAVLDVVDRTFEGGHEAALGGAFRHQPFLDRMPGRVDLWPVVPKPDKPEEKEWFDPIDLIGQTDAPVVLSARIAAEIGKMIREGVQIPDRGGFRPVRAGDFLILVQRRGEVFDAIIRACKAEGLPIAGPDRLTLTEELAVRDLLALLSFLNTPEDDLALATVLRSPLFGWSEDRLYRLAQPRKGYLWAALRESGDTETLFVLEDLRDRAEFLRPYELLDRILTRHGGRARLLGRMGEEAADAIDELSQQALAYERSEVPSLTGFLVWMDAGEVEVKRQAEGEGHMIRVMTVHGSKGLEAPVVILPDTADRRLDEKSLILPLEPGVVTWAGRKAEDTGAVAEMKARRAAAREAENLRLLYVAMTRARSWLMVAAAGEAGDGSWYGTIRKALETMPLEMLPDERLRHQYGEWPEDAPKPIQSRTVATLPDFALRPAPPAPAERRLWSPSGLGGEALVAATGAVPLLPSEPFAEDDPLERGTLLHLLLQHLADLPEADWAAAASRMGAAETALAEAVAILRDPDLTWIFGPGTLAEVEVTAPWNDDTLAGTIDRLVVTPERITVIDFKSNRAVPAGPDHVPEAYLRQLGAYAHAVGQIWPERQVSVAILWTAARRFMPLAPEFVSAALARAGKP